MSAPHDPSRRTVVQGVAWSLPVLAMAIAAPAATASPATLLTYDLDGFCGAQGIGFTGPSFRLSIPFGQDLPAGTTITVTGPSAGTLPWTLASETPGVPSPVVTTSGSGDTFVITLQQPWSGLLAFQAPLVVTAPDQPEYTAVLTLPPGYGPTPEADSDGVIQVTSTPTQCRDDNSDTIPVP